MHGNCLFFFIPIVVSWLVLSEIFPTPIKGRAFAATTVLNWSSNLIVSITMLDLIGEQKILYPILTLACARRVLKE